MRRYGGRASTAARPKPGCDTGYTPVRPVTSSLPLLPGRSQAVTGGVYTDYTRMRALPLLPGRSRAVTFLTDRMAPE